MRFVLIGALLSCACGTVSSPAADGGVDADPGAPVDATYTHYDAAGAPAAAQLVAFQDGGSPWRALAGGAGRYKFSVTGSRYAVAVACSKVGGGTSVKLYYLTRSDRTALVGTDACALGGPPTVKVSGVASNLQAGQTARISTGITNVNNAGGTFTLEARPGPGTLVAASFNGARATSLLVSPVTYASGQTFNLDFVGATALVDVPLRVSPATADVVVRTTFQDAQGRSHALDETDLMGGGYRAVPAGLLAGGLSSLVVSSSSATSTRVLARTFRTPVAVDLALPPEYVLPSSPRVATSSPYPLIEAVLPIRTGVSHYQLFYASFENRTVEHSWDISMTAAWAAGGGSGSEVKLLLPDLSKVDGWDPAFALGSGIAWSAFANAYPARFVPGAALAPLLEDGDEPSQVVARGSAL
jgi:hypothetical protein